MNLFTVDVEEWFHLCGAGPELGPDRWDRLPSRVVATTHRLLEMLARTGVPATFFVVGWIAERFPELVADIQGAGHEIGSHSHWHRRAYELTPTEFADDLRRSTDALVSAGVVAPRAYRAPEWSINERAPHALDILVRHGYRVDASMAPLRLVGRCDYPRRPHLRSTEHGSIVEVPPLVADRFGQVMPMGWGWGLRMSSPARVLRRIAEVNQRGEPAVITVHPWELDPEPPRVNMNARLWFAHYFRLDGFERRLETILHGASFTTLQAVAACVRG